MPDSREAAIAAGYNRLSERELLQHAQLREHVAEADPVLEAIVRDLADPDIIKEGQHDGPCVNYEGQDPEAYIDWDSCHRHLNAAADRQERLLGLHRRAREWVDRQEAST